MKERAALNPPCMRCEAYHRQMFRNENLDDMGWTKAIAWDQSAIELPKFHLDDPTLLVLEREAEAIESILFTLIIDYTAEKMTIFQYKKRVL
jgi:hypothetical protein